MSINLVALNGTGDILDIFYQTPTTLTRLCLQVSKEQAMKEYFYWIDKYVMDDTDEDQVEVLNEHKSYVAKVVAREDVTLSCV